MKKKFCSVCNKEYPQDENFVYLLGLDKEVCVECRSDFLNDKGEPIKEHIERISVEEIVTYELSCPNCSYSSEDSDEDYLIKTIFENTSKTLTEKSREYDIYQCKRCKTKTIII